MLNFEGIYICHEAGLEPDPHAQYWEYGHWDFAPEQLHYLRFFSDGLVIECTTGVTDVEQQTTASALKWFNREAVAVRRGNYDLSGDNLTFSTHQPDDSPFNKEGRYWPKQTVFFEGRVQQNLLDMRATYPNINKTFAREYVFKPD